MSVMQAKEFVKLNRELALLNIKIIECMQSIGADLASDQFDMLSMQSEEFLDNLIIELENGVDPEYISIELLEV